MAQTKTADDGLTPADLRRIRLQRHLSQFELARRCGVSRPYVAQVESGRLRPRSSFIALLRSLDSDPQASSDAADRITDLVAGRPALTRTDVVKALGRRSGTERSIDELLSAGRLEERLALGETSSSRLARRLFAAGTAPKNSHPDPVSGGLRSGRETVKMSQTELARRIGVTPAAIAKWEAHGAVPPRRAEELARVLSAAAASEIAAARQSAGWSRPELGRRVGVTGQMVRLWELGEPVSAKRRQALRLALEEARRAGAAAQLTASEALLELVRARGALTRTDLVAWRRRFQLDPGRAEAVIGKSRLAGELHEERRFTGPRRRPIRYLVTGPATAEAPPGLPGEELRALLEAAGLTPGELADRLGISAGAVRGWETGPAKVPAARVSEIGRLLAEHRRETSPAEEAAREILAVVARHPDIGRTELFERHVGDRVRSRSGLTRALEDGLVHEVLLELPRRSPYWGLRPGRADAGEEEPGWNARDLRQERQARGLTQGELARAVGVSASTVCSWETGKRSSKSRAAALSDALSRATARPRTSDVDRSLRAVSSAVERHPGEWSAPALLGRLRRKAAKAALELALAEGIVHEEHRLISDRRGRSTVRVRLYPGPAVSIGEWPAAPEGPEILALRRAANVSQGELARRVGVTQSAVALWEKGTPVPIGRREALRAALDHLSGAAAADARGRRLPRRDRPTVTQLVAEHPGSTRGELCARVNRKRRPALAGDIAAAIASGHLGESRVGRRVELLLAEHRSEV